MAFNYQKALDAGATEDQVLQYLTQTREYDIDGALKGGATKKQVIEYLSQDRKTTPPEKKKKPFNVDQGLFFTVKDLITKPEARTQAIQDIKDIPKDVADSALVKFFAPSAKKFTETIAGASVADGGLASDILRVPVDILTLGGGTRTKKAIEAAREAEKGRLEGLQKLTERIKEKKEKGEDVTLLVKALQAGLSEPGLNEADMNPALRKTAKQIAGEALGALSEVLLFTGLPGVSGAPGQIAKTVAQPSTFFRGAVKGAVRGLGTGGLFGTARGVSSGLQKNERVEDIVGEAIQQGTIGAVVGGVLGAGLGGLSGWLRGRQIRHQKIEEGLKATRQPADVIEYTKDTTGKIQIDPIAKEALRVGYDPRDVQFIKNSKPEDFTAYREMFDIGKKVSADRTVTQRAEEVGGKTLLNQAKFLFDQKKAVGAQLGEAVKKMGTKPIDVTQYADDYISNLEDAGVTIKRGVLKFDNSRYANTPSTQKYLQKVFDYLKPNQTGKVILPADRINTIRQTMRTDLDLGASTKELADQATRALENVYEGLRKPLVEASDDYAVLSNNYARLSNGLKDFTNLIGKRFRLDSDFAARRAGEVGSRVLGNASATTLQTVSNLEKLAQEFGMKGGGSAVNQFNFANLLQREVFPDLVPPGSLQGRITSGVEQAASGIKEAAGIISDVQQGSGGLTARGFDAVMKILKVARGITPEAHVKALEQLISAGQQAGAVTKIADVASGGASGVVSSGSKKAAEILKNALPTAKTGKYSLEKVAQMISESQGGTLADSAAIKAGGTVVGQSGNIVQPGAYVAADIIRKGADLTARVQDVAQKIGRLDAPGFNHRLAIQDFLKKINWNGMSLDSITKAGLDVIDDAGKYITPPSFARAGTALVPSEVIEKLQGIKRANPMLFTKAQKAGSVDDFIDSVVKAGKTTRENVSIPILNDFYNKVMKLTNKIK